MKCPKCGYLGFEPVDRCRHCGYDFSLTSRTVPLPELPIRTSAQTPQPLDDLSLIDAAAAPQPDVPMTDAGPDLDRLFGLPESDDADVGATERATASGVSSSSELPLFGGPIPDDEPLITRASPPRAPLSVRRRTPEVPRLRPTPSRPQASFELGLDLDPAAVPESPTRVQPSQRAMMASPAFDQREHEADEADDTEVAAVSVRFVAVLIDLVILAAIDVVVVYFTMQICGLAWNDLGVLPKIPLIAFMLVQNGGYLVAFTAGGQTLGKMATGIRVVGTGTEEGSLDLGTAITRTLVWLVLAIPAGLGFLTLLSRDHRGLHDRFAGTRVVRASA